LNDKSEDEREGAQVVFLSPLPHFASKFVHLPFADEWIWGWSMFFVYFDGMIVFLIFAVLVAPNWAGTCRFGKRIAEAVQFVASRLLEFVGWVIRLTFRFRAIAFVGFMLLLVLENNDSNQESKGVV